jgi:hypothetical protein
LATQTNPSSSNPIYTERNGESFIDDTTMWEVFLRRLLAELLPDLQMKAQSWERLIHAGGGALNLLKCFWYAIQWGWKPNGEAYICANEDHPELQLDLTQGDDHDTLHRIKKIEPTEGKRTLGVRLAPVGNNNEELDHRVDAGRKLRGRLKRAPLNRESTRIGLFAVAHQKVGYPLPATCFNHDECKKIQRTYMPTFLSKMGINRNSAAAFRSGPLHYGGMDIPEIETTQGASGNKLMLGHLRKNDMTGQTISVSLDALQLQAGTTNKVLESPGGRAHEYVDRCWVQHKWEYNDNYGLTIRRDDDPWLLPQREHDVPLMDRISNLQTITKSQLKSVHRCRMYLQADSLADIVTSDGTKLAPFMSATAPPNVLARTSSIHFPTQAAPDSKTWKIFVKMVRRAYCVNTTNDLRRTEGNSNELRSPLGKWYQGRIRQAWNQVYDSATDTIYSFDATHGCVREYGRRRRNMQRFSYRRNSEHATFPITALPISGTFQQGHFVIDSRSTAGVTYPPPTAPDTSLQRMLRGLRFFVTEQTLATAIWNGDVHIGTDGSVANDDGTFGFAILIHLNAEEPTLAASHGGNMPPIAEFLEMDSHRPEAGALFAAVTFLESFLSRYPNPMQDPPDFPLQITLDNKSVIQDTDRHYDDGTGVYDFLHADYDILQGIKATRARLPLKTSVAWVKGHQDDHKPWSELSIAAKANCHADDVCTKTHSKSLHRVGLFPTWVPGLRAALFHHGRLVTKKIDNYVMTASTAPRHQQYLTECSKKFDPFIANDWSDETFQDIDWFPLESSFKSMPFRIRIQIAKYIVNWTPTGHHEQ